MLKSPEGKPGILPATNDITVVTNDGDEIIDLHYFKNKLLQFKKNRIKHQCFIVNSRHNFQNIFSLIF